MEQDNQQLSTPPEKKFSLSKILKWIFWVLVLVCIIIIAIMSWLIIKENNAQTLAQTKQVITDTNKIISQSKLVFPKILNLTPLSSKNVPTNIQYLIFTGATSQVYNTIQYEGGEIGFQSSYIVLNMQVNQFMNEFNNQIMTLKNNQSWSIIYSIGTGLTGYFDFEVGTTSEQARVTFFQQNKNIKVVVQSLGSEK
jgi:hypothetical protein